MSEKPLPPDVLADALQDRIVPTSGRLLKADPVVPPSREAEIAADDVQVSLDTLGLGRGETVASLQRRLHVGAADAMRLFALREAVYSLLGQLQQARQERDALLAKPAFDPLMVKVASTLGANNERQRHDAQQERDNARREGWQTGYSASEETYGLLRAKATQAEAALQQAREVLTRYGQHDGGCKQLSRLAPSDGSWPCTCGLDAALQDEGR